MASKRWEEMSSCHHGIKTPKDTSLVARKHAAQFKPNVGKKKKTKNTASECWKGQALSTVGAAMVGRPNVSSNSVTRDKEGTVQIHKSLCHAAFYLNMLKKKSRQEIM